MPTAEKTWPIRSEVRCLCNHLIFDGEVIKGRVVRVLQKGAEAKCKRCGQWVAVPITYCKIC